MSLEEFCGKFFEGCSNGNLSELKELVNSSSFHHEKNFGLSFVKACRNGHLEVVKYLLEEFDSLNNNIPLGNTTIGQGIVAASQFPSLEIVQYLAPQYVVTNSTEDVIITDFFGSEDKVVPQLIDNHLNQAFVESCKNGCVEIIDYLLFSPELKSKADIHYQTDAGFIKAISCHHIKVVDYLIFEAQIKKTPAICDALKVYPRINGIVWLAPQADMMLELNQKFQMRNLKDSLEKELAIKSKKINGKKI